tara:strand:+ start:271 stop:717 length:447 start_codon:yes stop_codon:yes gene_type:complete
MKIIAANKRANHDYLISQHINAGLVLTGSEVKSLRINTGSIRGSFIIEKNGELWLSNCYIKKYNNSNDKLYNPNKDRKLLVTKKEINKILGQLKQGGISIVPISLFFDNKGFVKLNFGLGKGKKKFDKRQSIKEKDWNLKKERILKNN